LRQVIDDVVVGVCRDGTDQKTWGAGAMTTMQEPSARKGGIAAGNHPDADGNSANAGTPIWWGRWVQPLRASTILGGAVGYIRANPGLVLGMSAMGAAFCQGLTLLLQRAGDGPTYGLVAALGSSLVAVLLLGAVSGVLLGMLGQAFVRRRVRFGDVWPTVARRLPGVIGLALLVSLAVGVLAAVATSLMMVWARGVVEEIVGPLSLVGSVAAGLAAVWLGVRWSLAAPAYVFEDVGVGEALARSRRLVHGAWWRVFWYLLLTGLVGLAVIILVEFPFGHGTLVSPAVPWQSATIGEQLPRTLAVVISHTFALPLLAGVTGLLYVDQRVRSATVDSERLPAPDPDAPRVILRPRCNDTVMGALIAIVVVGAIVAAVAAAPTFRAQPTIASGNRSVTELAAARLDARPVVISSSYRNLTPDTGMIRVWDLATGAPIGPPIGVGGRAAMTTAELGGRTVILVGGSDGTVQAWDLISRSPVGAALHHDGPIRTLVAAALGERTVVVTYSADDIADRDLVHHEGTIRAWDLATGAPVGRPIDTSYNRSGAVTVVELDGRPVIVSGVGDDVLMWDLATGDLVDSAFTDPGYLTIWELDGRNVVLSMGSDGIRLRDLTTREAIGRPIDLDRRFSALSAARLDGRIVILTGSPADRGDNRESGAVQLWDLATGTQIGPPLTHTTTIPNDTGKFHPDLPSVHSVTTAEVDGRPVIVAGDSEGTIRIWDPFRWGWRYQG